jgi:hypothetical protein
VCKNRVLRRIFYVQYDFFPKIVPIMRHATDDNTIGRMHFSCWVNKATDTRSEYVILIAFLPTAKWARLYKMLLVHFPSCFVFR